MTTRIDHLHRCSTHLAVPRRLPTTIPFGTTSQPESRHRDVTFRPIPERQAEPGPATPPDDPSPSLPNRDDKPEQSRPDHRGATTQHELSRANSDQHDNTELIRPARQTGPHQPFPYLSIPTARFCSRRLPGPVRSNANRRAETSRTFPNRQYNANQPSPTNLTRSNQPLPMRGVT